MSKIECDTCKSIFKTKYNLKYHHNTSKKCLKLRGLELTSNFVCKGCDIPFVSHKNMDIHTDSCKKYIILKITEDHVKEINLLKSMHQAEKIEINNKNIIENTKLKVRYDELKERYDILEKQHEKMITKLELKIAQCDTFIQTIAEEGSRKVTTTNTINHIRNQLSSTYTIDNLEPKQVEDKMRQYYTENDFFGGQKRLAGVCVEKVIKTPDGKMMICCSDISRKKFKILDVQGNLKEDIEARLLCKKLKVPIQMITKEIYDKVIERIDTERNRLSTDDRSLREKLLDDSMRAQQVYIENLNFDDLNYNQDFMHELCVLLNV
jgi:hypothetical protein